MTELLANLGGAAEHRANRLVSGQHRLGGFLVDLRQWIERIGLPGQPLQIRLDRRPIQRLPESIRGRCKGQLRPTHFAFVDSADLPRQSNPLLRESGCHPGLTNSHPARVLAGFCEYRIDDLQRGSALRGGGAGQLLDCGSALGMRRILGKDLAVELKRTGDVGQSLLPELGEPIRDLPRLRALPFLGPAKIEREGQLPRLIQLGVEAVQGAGGLAIQPVLLGDLAPTSGGVLLSHQMQLVQRGRLAPERNSLGGFRRVVGELLQNLGQGTPLLAGAIEPLQNPQHLPILRIPRQRFIEVGDRPGGIAQLLLVEIGQLAMKRDPRRTEIRLQQLLHHLGESIHRIGIFRRLAGHIAKGGIGW